MIINEIREILSLIQGVPDMVIHVLLGFAVYKIIIFLGTSVGIYSTLRLAINKLYDYKSETHRHPKETIVKYDIKGKVIGEHSLAELESLFNIVRNRKERMGITGSYKSEYLHRDDVQFIIDAVLNKIEREKKV